MQIPITVARRDYIKAICDLTNNSGLPAFAVADVLEKVLADVRRHEGSELKRDEAIWHKAMSEVRNNGSDQPISDENSG